MKSSNSKGIAVIGTEQQAIQSGLVITRRRRSVDSVEVLISELRSLGSANFQFTLFAWLDGISIGLIVSVGITLMTITFSETQLLLYVTFLVLLCVSIFATLAFTVLMIIYGLKSRRQENEILSSGQVEVEQQINIPTNKDI